MPAILLVALASYTVFRLQHLATNLPYEPGPPLPFTEVAAAGDADLATRLRQVFLDGRSANVLGEPGVRYECWPLAGLERERARRMLDELRAREPGALVEALRELVEGERAFVLEAEPLPQSADGWRYWRAELFAVRDRRRVLFVPIDAARFPDAR